MRPYPVLPENHLWTIVDFAESGTDTIVVEAGEKTVYLKKTAYSKEVYQDILKQSEVYTLVRHSILETTTGKEENHGTENILSACIVVKDNEFVGVLTLCTSEEETHLHTTGYTEHTGLLFADGTRIGVNSVTFDRRPGYWHFQESYSLVRI